MFSLYGGSHSYRCEPRQWKLDTNHHCFEEFQLVHKKSFYWPWALLCPPARVWYPLLLLVLLLLARWKKEMLSGLRHKTDKLLKEDDHQKAITKPHQPCLLRAIHISTNLHQHQNGRGQGGREGGYWGQVEAGKWPSCWGEAARLCPWVPGLSHTAPLCPRLHMPGKSS